MLKRFLILAVSLALCLPCFAANEIQQFWVDRTTSLPKTGESGVYAVIQRLSPVAFWETAAEDFNTVPEAYANCAIALSENATQKGLYVGTFPQAVPRGSYFILVRQIADATPSATADIVIGGWLMEWDGTAEVTLARGVNVALIEGVDATDQLTSYSRPPGTLSFTAVTSSAEVLTVSCELMTATNPPRGSLILCVLTSGEAVGDTYIVNPALIAYDEPNWNLWLDREMDDAPIAGDTGILVVQPYSDILDKVDTMLEETSPGSGLYRLVPAALKWARGLW
jgi:hypothetical protein